MSRPCLRSMNFSDNWFQFNERLISKLDLCAPRKPCCQHDPLPQTIKSPVCCDFHNVSRAGCLSEHWCLLLICSVQKWNPALSSMSRKYKTKCNHTNGETIDFLTEKNLLCHQILSRMRHWQQKSSSIKKTLPLPQVKVRVVERPLKEYCSPTIQTAHYFLSMLSPKWSFNTFCTLPGRNSVEWNTGSLPDTILMLSSLKVVGKQRAFSYTASLTSY